MISEFELFIDEAERLTDKSFYRHFLNNEVGFSPNGELDNSPNDEQIESYVLHFRKFLQRNDRIYVYKIDESIHLYLDINKTNNFNIKHWTKVFDTLDYFLNAQSLIERVKLDMGIEDYSKLSFTLLQIFKIKTYGDLAHLDRSKRETHLKLSSNRRIESLYKHEYCNLLFESGELILELANLLKTLQN